VKPDSPLLGAVILVGGGSRRMGQDKATLAFGGVRAVDRLRDMAFDIGGRWVITAGGDYGGDFVDDPFPGAGPVAGLLAGAAFLRAKGALRGLILAVDAPTLTREDLAPLLASPPPGAAYAGYPAPMVVDLEAIPWSLEGDAPLRRFVDRAGVVTIAPAQDLVLRIRGANTPEERAALLRDGNA